MLLFLLLLNVFDCLEEARQLLERTRLIQKMSEVDLASFGLIFLHRVFVLKPVTKNLLSKAANHIDALTIFLPGQLRVFALPALVSGLVTLVALATDARIEDSRLAAPNGQPLRNVLLEGDVHNDSVDLDSFRIRTDSGWK